MMCIILAGCSTQSTDPVEVDDGVVECETAADCVPALECHPKTCVPKASVEGQTGPDICTKHFECEAAYTAEACGCVENKCVNLNIGVQC